MPKIFDVNVTEENVIFIVHKQIVYMDKCE